jgi:hypothetical protein
MTLPVRGSISIEKQATRECFPVGDQQNYLIVNTLRANGSATRCFLLTEIPYGKMLLLSFSANPIYFLPQGHQGTKDNTQNSTLLNVLG